MKVRVKFSGSVFSIPSFSTEEGTTMLKIVCNGEVLEQVNSFRYLGAIITSTGDCSVEIRSRLGSARSAITSLNSMWKDRALSKELKARLMRLPVWPVATYECETWTLKASDRKRISAFEMTILEFVEYTNLQKLS